MITGSNIPNNQEPIEHAISMKDFVMGERIKKITTHE